MEANKILQGDCIEVMKGMEANSIDTIISDVPYGIKFMGKKWDYDVPSVEVFEEMLRVAKPGATALIFAGARTQHKIATNIEDAGWILKDVLLWIFGSGFPKATDISKQLDKKAGKEPRVVGQRTDGRYKHSFQDTNNQMGQLNPKKSNVEKIGQITEPATPEAKLWNGWKCVSEDTEILTVDGWKSIGKIKVEDKVFSYNMRGIIKVNSVKNVFIYDYKGELINIKNRHTDQLLTPNHNVVCKKYNRLSVNGKRVLSFDKKWGYINAKDLDSSQFQIPTAGLYNGDYFIGEDMAELIGWILTEGDYRKTSNGINITQSSVNKDKVDRIRSLLDRLNIKYNEGIYNRVYKERKFQQHQFRLSAKDNKIVRIRNLLPYKKPISLLWHLPLKEKYRLYESLILGDGFRNNECEQFSQKDKEFLDWFQVFGALIGCSIKVNYKNQRATIKIGKQKNYAGLTMYNKNKIDYEGKVWSIETEMGNYIARRNGKIFITGNSHGLKPAYEPIIWATKSLTFDKERSILKDVNNNLLFNVWLLLANTQKLDTYKSQVMASISLSIVLLWNAILGELWKNESKFTTLTVSKTIIELKTLNFLLSKNMQEDMVGKSQTFQNGIQRFQANGFSLLVQFAESCLEKERKNINDILKAIAQETATWRLKEKIQYDTTVSAKSAEKDLFPELLIANTVLLNVTIRLMGENNVKELKEIVSFAEKNLKLYYQDQQNSVMPNVWENIEPRLRPDFSPIIVAMKPNEGTYAQNALKHGVSGLNIDGGRIGTDKIHINGGGGGKGTGWGKKEEINEERTGRFPANILMSRSCDYSLKNGIIKEDKKKLMDWLYENA